MSIDPKLLALAQHFAVLSLISISGAIALAPEMHRFLVDEKHWLSHTQFTDSIALAQSAPGPNVLFVALLGWQVASWAGAVVSLVSLMLPSSLIVYSAWRWKSSREESVFVHALRLGLSPIAVGLMMASGVVLIESAVFHQTQSPGSGSADSLFVWNPKTWPLLLVALATVAFSLKSKRNPLWMILLGALVGMLLSQLT